MMARLRVGLLAVAAGLLCAIATPSPAGASDAAAATCYDDGAWLIYSDGVTVRYADGVTVSATREDFTACLYVAARRHQALAIRGQLVPGGVLLDLGGTSVYWRTGGQSEDFVNVTAFDDRIVVSDQCDVEFELRGQAVAMIDQGFPCSGGRIHEVARPVTAPDFTIFVIRRQFVVDGEEGWYHIVRDQTGFGEDPTPRSQIRLRTLGGGIAVTTETDVVGMHYDVHDPLAGNAADPQQHQVSDWMRRVRHTLIPRSFGSGANYLWPDREAYWAEVRGWLSAILDDLFHGRAEPVHLQVGYPRHWEAAASGRTIVVGSPDILAVLHGLAHVIAGSDEEHDGRFTAALVMLWGRYVRDFDTVRAIRLAERYGVQIGPSTEVEPVSSRTSKVHELLGKPPPVLPSDDTPIEPDEMLLRVVLTVGETYGYGPGTIVATSRTMPRCTVSERYADGTTYQLIHGPYGWLTIRAGGSWNGLFVWGYGGAEQSGLYVSGTPTVPGRVRVQVMTKCPGGYSQEPRLVGYSEIIVVDPASAE